MPQYNNKAFSPSARALQRGAYTTALGTAGIDGLGNLTVTLDGAAERTPVASSAVSVAGGDRVSVTIMGGRAMITGNLSSPPDSGPSFGTMGGEGEMPVIIIGDTPSYLGAYEDPLVARLAGDEVSIGTMDGEEACRITKDSIRFGPPEGALEVRAQEDGGFSVLLGSAGLRITEAGVDIAGALTVGGAPVAIETEGESDG